MISIGTNAPIAGHCHFRYYEARWMILRRNTSISSATDYHQKHSIQSKEDATRT